MNKITYRGAGCNGPSLLTAITNAIITPSKKTVPAGATWPLVTLSVAGQAVEFNMLHIQRNVMPEDVTEVSLSKIGYLFFCTSDHTYEFGFATLKMASLMKELRERGYRLDESCDRNIFFARTSLVLLTAIPLLFLVVIVIMTILKPNGV